MWPDNQRKICNSVSISASNFLSDVREKECVCLSDWTEQKLTAIEMYLQFLQLGEFGYIIILGSLWVYFIFSDHSSYMEPFAVDRNRLEVVFLGPTWPAMQMNGNVWQTVWSHTWIKWRSDSVFVCVMLQKLRGQKWVNMANKVKLSPS